MSNCMADYKSPDKVSKQTAKNGGTNCTSALECLKRKKKDNFIIIIIVIIITIIITSEYDLKSDLNLQFILCAIRIEPFVFERFFLATVTETHRAPRQVN